jgi:hypothetical protein
MSAGWLLPQSALVRPRKGLRQRRSPDPPATAATWAQVRLLLISLVEGTVSSPGALRQQLVTNFTDIGSYPTNCSLVGVSNGDITGTGNGTPEGTQIVTFEKDLNAINGQLYSAPGDASQSDLIFYSRILTSTTTESFPSFSDPGPQLDTAPGGYADFFLQIYDALSGYNPTIVADNATFIPIGSALAINDISLYSQQDLFLDLQTDPQPSDLGNIYADTANNPHVTVTAGIATFLLAMVANARSTAAAAARGEARPPVPPPMAHGSAI